MDESSAQSVTLLLSQVQEGDRGAKERLFQMVERELRAIAEKQMRGERDDHSLQATVLINDVFMRLAGDETDFTWHNRKHFYRTAARAMRRMLIDHERKRRAQRRGAGEHQRAGVDPDLLGGGDVHFDILALDEALRKLTEIDPRQCDIVALHHFGGRSLSEVADILDVSVSTVKADWRLAKAWLHRELTRGEEQS